MNARRGSSGESARRRRAKFSASIAPNPTAKTAASVSATGKLTVAGDSASAAVATASTSAFVTNSRQKSGSRRSGGRPRPVVPGQVDLRVARRRRRTGLPMTADLIARADDR
jgi:hypothetical protein